MENIISRAAKLAVVAATILGIAIGCFMFYAAGSHNPQQEFHGAQWSGLLSWILVFASWFVVAFLAAFVSIFSLLCAFLTIRNSTHQGASKHAEGTD